MKRKAALTDNDNAKAQQIASLQSLALRALPPGTIVPEEVRYTASQARAVGAQGLPPISASNTYYEPDTFGNIMYRVEGRITPRIYRSNHPNSLWNAEIGVWYPVERRYTRADPSPTINQARQEPGHEEQPYWQGYAPYFMGWTSWPGYD